MEHLKNYCFEIMIGVSGTLLLINQLLPEFLHEGINICLLFLFLISILLRKLETIDNHMKEKL